jgi:GH15 family glucan-1,4-alpha-glucosidase
MNYNNDLTNAPADVKSNPKKNINYLSQISKKYPNMEIYRWVEVEPIILKNVDATIQYMIYFLKGKEWKQGQQALQNIPGAWDKYVQTNFRLSKSKNPSKPGFGWFDTRFKKD